MGHHILSQKSKHFLFGFFISLFTLGTLSILAFQIQKYKSFINYFKGCILII